MGPELFKTLAQYCGGKRSPARLFQGSGVTTEEHKQRGGDDVPVIT
jgi:hypothetical protein